MEKRWTIVASDAVKTEALQAALNINKTICSILVARGLETFEASKNFYRP
ncbi:MAG: single-stranded-DNA-specific exonuclease RecJ, partial [Bacteroidota bacterium]